MWKQVSDKELMDTELRLKSINALAQVVRAQRADVKAEYMLGIGGFDLDRVADEVRDAQIAWQRIHYQPHSRH